MNFIPIDTLSKNTKGYIPKRCQIYVGFRCNQRCVFCYYLSKCNEKMFTRDRVIKQLDIAYAYGIRDFEFTGGEPSLCDKEDLRYYFNYIKNRDSNSKIAVITNGTLSKLDKSIWGLIDEVLLSFHETESNIKSITRNKSTYSNAVKTVELSHKYNKVLRTNTVLGTFNYNETLNITKELLSFSPKIINFLPVNLWGDASKMQSSIDYSILRMELKKAFNLLDNKILSFVRFIPFCDMVGYEKHIVGNLQHAYDWFDWNIEMMSSLLELPNNEINHYIPTSCYAYNTGVISRVQEIRAHSYIKPNKCIKCKHYFICDGVEKAPIDLTPFIIVNNSSKPITNFMYYLGDSTYTLYSELYRSKNNGFKGFREKE